MKKFKKNNHKFSYWEYFDPGFYLLLFFPVAILSVCIGQFIFPSPDLIPGRLIILTIISIVMIILIVIRHLIKFRNWRTKSYDEKLDKLKLDIEKVNDELAKLK